ncbi:MAG: hypothetical protein JWP63_7165 [Candidatus Solibacter sp.]|nr:hypothetical protein [Candidatus Solibacter sp.]
MSNSQRNQLRRASMFGTMLFALGIIAAIAFVVTGSLWLIGAAAVCLVPAVVMLYRVGQALPR